MKVNNLGPISQGEIKIAPLTILCGGNNQGKTYLSYTLYGLLRELPLMIKNFLREEEIDEFMEVGKLSFGIDYFQSRIVENILVNLKKEKLSFFTKVFKAKKEMFNDTDLDVSSEEIINILGINNINFGTMKGLGTQVSIDKEKDTYFMVMYSDENNKSLPIDSMTIMVDRIISLSIRDNINSLYFPAERMGINVFRRQLNLNKIEMVDILNDAINMNNNDEDILKAISKIKSVFPKPIDDYLKYISDINYYESTTNELSSYVRDKIIRGKFIVDDNENSFYKIKSENNKNINGLIPLHIASSSIKSIYGLDYFLDNLDFEINSIVIIDEPEMNLHPSNQVEIAYLLDMMVASGIKVVISTHSDFLVRKIQNIMLNNEIEENTSGLNSKNVKVYDFINSTIQEIDLLDDTKGFHNFNDTVELIEDEYLDLLDKLAEKRDKE
ncbi:MAG: AAA family ATPase [Clostridium sp.]